MEIFSLSLNFDHPFRSFYVFGLPSYKIINHINKIHNDFNKKDTNSSA